MEYMKRRDPVDRRPRILVIFGSTRQERRGDRVVAWLMERLSARSEASFELVDVRALGLPLFDAAVSPSRGPIMPEAAAWAAQVDQADGFIFVTPEYNHGYPAALKNAIDHLYQQWVHKPAAIVSYGGFASGYRAAEQLRLVLIEVKMVPIREQVGVSLVPGAVPGLDAEAGTPGAAYLQRALDSMLAELLWWEAALTPARARDRAGANG
jgi:NAD(P)H-dependent FMN reductase